MPANPARRGGFTLIESLVALGIASAIVLSTATLIHDGAFFFDRGTRAVDQTDEFALAVDCLTRDLGAARFVTQKGAGARAAFTGGQERILFVTGGGRESGPQGEEIVEYSVERDGDASRLVRRRAPWLGPRTNIEEAELGDPVILLAGSFEASFAFSDVASNGSLIWRDEWTDEPSLPRSVRLALRDPEAGEDLLAGDDFMVRADAPIACASGKENCLAFVKRAPAAAVPSQAQAQTR